MPERAVTPPLSRILIRFQFGHLKGGELCYLRFFGILAVVVMLASLAIRSKMNNAEDDY